jgi:serine/threonine-protein kinase
MTCTLAPGAIIASRYRLERLVGEGGMGAVWAATHGLTRREVALKFLKAANDPSDLNRHRLLREARAAGAILHPNVVEVYDVLEIDGGAPVIVMELLRGESLQVRLEREGRLPIAEACAILGEVAAGVAAAHAAGVVHRDLKPDNVWLASYGDRTVVKVLDFGVAKMTAAAGAEAHTFGLTRTGALVGTPTYMSPEQASGESDIDPRSDVWSMGILLYQAITGVVPTRGDNFGQVFKTIITGNIAPLAELAPETPPDILDVVARMLEVDRDARLADLGELRDVLARHASPTVAHAPASARVEYEATQALRPSTTRPARRARTGWAILAAGLATATVSATVLAMRRAPPAATASPSAPAAGTTREAHAPATPAESPTSASVTAPASPPEADAPQAGDAPIAAQALREAPLASSERGARRPNPKGPGSALAPRVTPAAATSAKPNAASSDDSLRVTHVPVQREW